MDNELFELCKEVYKRTGWDVPLDWNNSDSFTFSHFCYEWDDNGYKTGEKWVQTNYSIYMASEEGNKICPAYTSDYLLEKLPEWTTVTKVGNDTGKYNASYELGYITSLGDTYLQGTSDTPLKALLKLVIALDDAGVKL